MVIHTKHFPPGGYKIINLFGFIFYKGKNPLSDVDINHENIHSYQMLDLFILGLLLMLLIILIFNISWWWLLLSIPSFYIWYGVEYVIVRLFHKKQGDAYHDISLEEEAYNNEDNLEYLKHRKMYNWFQYLKVKSNK